MIGLPQPVSNKATGRLPSHKGAKFYDSIKLSIIAKACHATLGTQAKIIHGLTTGVYENTLICDSA